jgi:hypothetical protein
MRKMISGMLLSVLILLVAVNLQAQVTSYSDQSADFSKYRTYSFLGWQQASDSLLEDIDKERLQKAFKSEFDARNLSYVQSGGDMLVSLYIILNVKSDSITYSDFVVNSGMTPLETSIPGEEYEEGTLVLSCYDAGEGRVIFQGVKVKTIQKNPSRREKTIPRAVARLMRKFPL